MWAAVLIVQDTATEGWMAKWGRPSLLAPQAL